MRKEFEMTESDLAKLIADSRPLPYIIAGGLPPMSMQERANNAWVELGDRMGFDGMSVRASPKGDRFFTAVPK